MSWRFERYHRLESASPDSDIDRGFNAEIADPLYFIGRQWQMGEHQGEDAASPMEVIYKAEHFDIDPLVARPNLDPTITPPEVIVETEIDEWWTPGRRIHLGKEYTITEGLNISDINLSKFLIKEMPPPYSQFNLNAFDGIKLWKNDPTHAVFDDVPNLPAVDHWDTAELSYNAEFKAGGQKLKLKSHDGGHLDWYSVDADGPIPPPQEALNPIRILPSRMRYPGSPHPRWWQIEDHAVDIGGMAPERGNFATMLLIDLVMGHSDDWYTFPVITESGNVVRLSSVTVKDSFDDEWSVTPPNNWSMFDVKGLKPTSLLVWPTVTSPLNGNIIEDVDFGIDEDANVLWAIEKRINGHDLGTEMPVSEPAIMDAPIDGSLRQQYKYVPSEGLRKYWHPYVIQEVNDRRVFVQGRAADINGDVPVLFPEPQAVVLYDYSNFTEDPDDQAGNPVHQIEPYVVSPTGFSIQRRWKLVRNTNSEPLLWVERLRKPLKVPSASSLKFDALHRISETSE